MRPDKEDFFNALSQGLILVHSEPVSWDKTKSWAVTKGYILWGINQLEISPVWLVLGLAVQVPRTS